MEGCELLDEKIEKVIQKVPKDLAHDVLLLLLQLACEARDNECKWSGIQIADIELYEQMQFSFADSGRKVRINDIERTFRVRFIQADANVFAAFVLDEHEGVINNQALQILCQ